MSHIITTRINGYRFDTNNVKVVWFRRLGQPVIPQSVPERYKKFCLAECNHLLESMLSILTPDHWINEYWSCRKVSLKPWQYKVAAQAGPRTPVTLTSNDHHEILKN